MEDIAQKINECNGIRLKALIWAGIKCFESHKNEVDKINVFPVPDGDTGKNMYNTFLTVWQSVKEADRHSAGKVAHAAAKGAFQGARGCSGIILSGLLSGFSDAVKEKDIIRPEDFAIGLGVAAEGAYKQLAEPKEGTMLTIARRIAAAAKKTSEAQSSFPDLLRAIYDEAKEALADTPNQLPVLKEAGVVDAGASGLVHFFEGMFLYSLGQSPDKPGPEEASSNFPRIKETVAEEYCVEFILSGKNVALDKLMKTLTEIGHSVIINRGEEERFRVHIHAIDPKKIFDRTSRFGKPTHIKVDDLSHDHKQYLRKLGR